MLAELLKLAGPWGDQTGETVGVGFAGGLAGNVPAGEAAGDTAVDVPGVAGVGGSGTAFSGEGPGGLARDGSLTPAG